MSKPLITSNRVTSSYRSSRSIPSKTDKQNPKSGWGYLPKPRKFSYRSENTLKQAAIVLESLGVSNILIITLTLPGSTQGALDALERYSGFAVNRFNQYLRRWLKKAIYLYCWEYQDRGALHLHYAVCVPLEIRSRFTKDKLQSEWHNILQSVSAKASVDVFEIDGGYTWRDNPEKCRIDVQECQHSVVSYFSKHDQKKPRLDEAGRYRSPGCWSNISKSLRHRMEQLSFTRVFLACCKDEAFRVIYKAGSQLSGLKKPLHHPITGNLIGISIDSDRKSFASRRELLQQFADSIPSQITCKMKYGIRCENKCPQMFVFQLLFNGYCKLRLTDSKKFANLLDNNSPN